MLWGDASGKGRLVDSKYYLVFFFTFFSSSSLSYSLFTPHTPVPKVHNYTLLPQPLYICHRLQGVSSKWVSVFVTGCTHFSGELFHVNVSHRCVSIIVCNDVSLASNFLFTTRTVQVSHQIF